MKDKGTIKILITGPQGIGKTTLATIINEHLEGLGLVVKSEEPLSTSRPLFRRADFIRKEEIEIQTSNEEAKSSAPVAKVRPEIEIYTTQCDFTDQWEELDFHLEDAEDQAARAYQETNDNDRAEYTGNAEEALQMAASIIDRMLYTLDQSAGVLPLARCGQCIGCESEKEIKGQ